MLFTDTMTVYNHYTTASADCWHRSVVRGVQWSHNKIRTSAQGNTLTQSKVESITVDFTRVYNNPTYINPIDFAKLENKEGFYTFDSSGLDVVVLGESSQEISASYKLSNLHKDNQYVGTVTEVSDNRNRTYNKNIKVVAQ